MLLKYLKYQTRRHIIKWFKHDSNALHDAKIEKLIMKYGIEGYGLYFACIEIIANELTRENITFELEHDAEILAHKFKIDTLKVEKIMKYCIELGLFQYNIETQRIVCYKLARRLDISMSQNPEIKQILSSNNFKKLLESNSRLDENRIDKIKEEKKPDDRLKPYLPLSELLYYEHKKVDDKYLKGKYLPDIWERWANDIRLLVEKDGRTIEEVEQVIKWVKTEGNFWFVNIMSGKKLRLQFPKLILQMKQEGKNPGSFKGTDKELHSYDEFFGGSK